MKKVLLSTLLALLACTASAEERYISMRNVDIGMAGQGYCSLVFNLTASAPFDNPLEVEVGLYNDDEEVYKALMEVKPFSQARANETQYCFAEWPCDEVTKAKVLNVWEIVDGKRVQLPREIIVPDNYQPVPVE